MDDVNVYEVVKKYLVDKGNTDAISSLEYSKFIRMSHDLYIGDYNSVNNIGKTFSLAVTGGDDSDIVKDYISLIDYVMKKNKITSNDLLKSLYIHNLYWESNYHEISQIDYFDKMLIKEGFDGKMMRQVIAKLFPEPDIIVPIVGGGDINKFNLDKREMELKIMGAKAISKLWNEDVKKLAADKDYIEKIKMYSNKNTDVIGPKSFDNDMDAANHLIKREKMVVNHP